MCIPNVKQVDRMQIALFQIIARLVCQQLGAVFFRSINDAKWCQQKQFCRMWVGCGFEERRTFIYSQGFSDNFRSVSTTSKVTRTIVLAYIKWIRKLVLNMTVVWIKGANCFFLYICSTFKNPKIKRLNKRGCFYPNFAFKVKVICAYFNVFVSCAVLCHQDTLEVYTTVQNYVQTCLYTQFIF